MKPIFTLVSMWALLASPIVARADDKPYIAVGEARAKRAVIAFPEIKPAVGQPTSRKQIHDIVKDDLEFMEQFRFLEPNAFIETQGGIKIGEFKFTDWGSIGSDLLIKSSLSQEAANIALEGHLY